MLVESLLFVSAASATVASVSKNSRVARFGLGFFCLFSSLAIYARGETTSAMVYLVTVGIVLAGFVACLEAKSNMKASHDRSQIRMSVLPVLCMIGAFITTYLASRNFNLSISLSIAFVATVAITSRNLVRIIIGLVTLESAALLVLAEMGRFTAISSIPICLLMLASSVGLPYALSHRFLK